MILPEEGKCETLIGQCTLQCENSSSLNNSAKDLNSLVNQSDAGSAALKHV